MVWCSNSSDFLKEVYSSIIELYEGSIWVHFYFDKIFEINLIRSKLDRYCWTEWKSLSLAKHPCTEFLSFISILPIRIFLVPCFMNAWLSQGKINQLLFLIFSLLYCKGVISQDCWYYILTIELLLSIQAKIKFVSKVKAPILPASIKRNQFSFSITIQRKDWTSLKMSKVKLIRASFLFRGMKLGYCNSYILWSYTFIRYLSYRCL